MIKDNKLLVNEIFESIDGEGYHAGRPTVFFRTVGCNLRCSWCFGPNQNGNYPKVTLPDLTQKSINEVEVGDIILTYKDKNCKEIVETTVTNTGVREVTEYERICTSQNSFIVTPEHPFMIKNQDWKEASDIEVGDRLVNASSIHFANYTISSFLPDLLKYTQTVYNEMENLKGNNKGIMNGNYNENYSYHNLDTLKMAIKKGVANQDIILGVPCKNLIVHHLDGNHDNDSLDNMIIISRKLHDQIHARGNSFWKNSKTVEPYSGIPVISHTTNHENSKGRIAHQLGNKPKNVISISCAPYNTYLIDNIYVHNCDSTYTFKPEDTSKWMTIEQAIEEVEKFGWKHITITGGEPLMEENKSWMIKFMRTLQEKGYSIDVETNGSIDLEPYVSLFDELFANGKHDAMNEDRSFVTFIMDWKAPSSKMTNKMLPKNLLLLSDTDIVKVVVSDDDFNTVLDVLKSGTVAQVYISPCFGKVDMEKLPNFIMEHGKEYPNLKAQIQMHKIFWSDPNKRGV